MSTFSISRGLKEALIPLVLGPVLVIGSGCAEEAPTEVDAAGNPPVGVVDDTAGFYVRAQRSVDYTYYTHKGSNMTYSGSLDWGSGDCVATAGQDIMCYVEAAELDLYFNGLTLQHNVPSSLCTYLQVSMPWYYAMPAGMGPSQVQSVQFTQNNVTRNIDVANSVNGTPHCPFDYSQGGTVALPNCCEGTYSRTVSVDTDDPNASGAAAVSRGGWGGSNSACVAGPAMDLMEKSESGYPLDDLSFIKGVGVNAIYEIPSPLSKSNSNYYAANYFDLSNAGNYLGLDLTEIPPMHNPYANPYVVDLGAGVGATATQISSNAAATSNDGSTVYPTTVNSTGALPLGASSGFITQPYYEYTCLDNHREVNARIRVMVRSWDLKSGFASGTPYTPSYAYETSFPDELNHDRMVFGDLFFNYSAGTSVSNSAGTFRRSIGATTSAQCTSTANSTYPCQEGYTNPFTTGLGSGFPMSISN